MNAESTLFFLLALYWAGFMTSVGILGLMVWFVVNTVRNLFKQKKE